MKWRFDCVWQVYSVQPVLSGHLAWFPEDDRLVHVRLYFPHSHIHLPVAAFDLVKKLPPSLSLSVSVS